jgi:hypothetical protein
MPTILHDSNTDQQAAEQNDDLPIEVLFGRRNPRVSEIHPAAVPKVKTARMIRD